MAITYDYKKFQEEHFDNKLLPDQWHKRPTTVIIDDIFSDKPYTQKGTSMSIFKFTTTKPSASKIWTTLIDTTISPREGYTKDQIRYRMFIVLQLATDFKISVSICNALLDSEKTGLEPLLSATRSLASCSESDFSDLSVSSEAFPHWVEPELYTPYYLTKQLCMKLPGHSHSLLCSLFDREELQDIELSHLDIDYGVVPDLTAYKLMNSIESVSAMDWINISYNQMPLQVSSKEEIKLYILEELLDALDKADNFIIPEGSKITIPYFILKTDTTVPQTRSSSSTRPFVVGDRVRLRQDLEVDKYYGNMKFLGKMLFSVVANIKTIDNDGDIRVDGLRFVYSPEMLEHAEGDTDASQ